MRDGYTIFDSKRILFYYIILGIPTISLVSAL